MEPKTPEDIYKTNLTENRNAFGANVDSARNNLASTFVNAFVNAAFGQDKLMTDEGDSHPLSASAKVFSSHNHRQRPNGYTRTGSTA